MRCFMTAILALGILGGVAACTPAQRQATTKGALDGATDSPAAPPAGGTWDQFALYYLAYLAGSATKKGMGMAKDKLFKGAA